MQDMRKFLIVWFGQMISLAGSGLTFFALGVQVFQDTGQVTAYALILLFTVLPRLFIAPFSGVVVDRFNRRLVMIASDVGAGICTLVLVLLLFGGNLEIWHIYILTAINSSFMAFQTPAYIAAATQLVPKHKIEQAAGMVQLGEATQIISPLLAGFLLPVIQLNGILVIDFATFAIAVLTLTLVRFPDVKTSKAGTKGKGTFFEEMVYGWTYLTAKPGFIALLLFFAVSNFLVGTVEVLVVPLVLIIADPRTLGILMFVGGLGFLVGSIWMSASTGPRRNMPLIFGGMFMAGLSIAATGTSIYLPFLAVCAFLIFLCQPIIRGSNQAIFQKKVDLDMQGRVFAMRDMVVQATFPLAHIFAGPLTDRVFEPLMAADGLLAGSMGQLIGVGPGRGIALLFIVLGILTTIVTVFAYRYAPLRLIEERLPDAVEDDEVDEQPVEVLQPATMD